MSDTRLTPSKRTCPKCGLDVPPNSIICPRDGTQLIHVQSPAQAAQTSTATFQSDPQFLGKYEFLGTIGSGGMGVIYKARQIILDKFVAIKMLHPHLVSPEAYARFKVEGKAANLLASHPLIITMGTPQARSS